MLVESQRSWPPIASCSSAASSTVRAIGPAWSRLEENAIRPYRDTGPYVGLCPTSPVTAAGWRIEPPVSVPIAQGARPPATAAAEPPEEPPGNRSRPPGVRGAWAPGVASDVVRGVLRGGAHRELVHVGLAQQDGAGRGEPGGDGGVVGRSPA